MSKVIIDGLQKGISYEAYVELVSSLVAANSTTGDDKSKDYVDYTKLNEKRMKRWDKTLKISDVVKTKILEFNHPVTWLVLTESWCGDAAHVLPVLNKIAELNEAIDLKIVLRDYNPELMDT